MAHVVPRTVFERIRQIARLLLNTINYLLGEDVEAIIYEPTLTEAATSMASRSKTTSQSSPSAATSSSPTASKINSKRSPTRSTRAIYSQETNLVNRRTAKKHTMELIVEPIDIYGQILYQEKARRVF